MLLNASYIWNWVFINIYQGEPTFSPRSSLTTTRSATKMPTEDFRMKVKFHPHWDEYFQEKELGVLIPAYTGSPGFDSPRPSAIARRPRSWRLSLVYFVCLILTVRNLNYLITVLGGGDFREKCYDVGHLNCESHDGCCLLCR